MIVFQDSKFIQQISPRVTAVCDALNTWLDDTCVAAIRATDAATRDSEQSQLLARCLRIYATIDRVANIEKLVRDQIVKVMYLIRAANEPSAKFSQARRRPLLGPSPS